MDLALDAEPSPESHQQRDFTFMRGGFTFVRGGFTFVQEA